MPIANDGGNVFVGNVVVDKSEDVVLDLSVD
jgi:hypothetical protein